MRVLHFLFSFNGRSGRLEFFLATFVISSLSGGVGLLRADSRLPLLIAAALLSIIMLVSGFAVTVKRLHDLNQTGWLSLLPGAIMGFVIGDAVIQMTSLQDGDITGFANLIEHNAILFTGATLVTIAFTGWLTFTRGSTGSNDYGPPFVLFPSGSDDDMPVMPETPAPARIVVASSALRQSNPPGFGRRGRV